MTAGPTLDKDAPTDVGTDNGMVFLRIEFPDNTTRLFWTPEQARNIAADLVRHAAALEAERRAVPS